jgi:histidinol phosphatase-like PHP family hydrolase
MAFGLAVNCGKGFPVETDEGALEFLKEMEGQPVFIGMQAEGREWVDMFSPEVRAQFDYVFTDSMTFTDHRGNRTRLWMPDEVEVGDEQAFMDMLVEKTVGILENEPIDIYVNPTFLPEVIAGDYDRLWTEKRMKAVIDAAVANHIAIEIGARYKLPSERFLRMAKEAGAKFTFGTNNTGADDLGDWSYPLEMQRSLELGWQDMFVPGHAPSRAQRDLAASSAAD